MSIDTFDQDDKRIDQLVDSGVCNAFEARERVTRSAYSDVGARAISNTVEMKPGHRMGVREAGMELVKEVKEFNATDYARSLSGEAHVQAVNLFIDNCRSKQIRK